MITKPVHKGKIVMIYPFLLKHEQNTKMKKSKQDLRQNMVQSYLLKSCILYLVKYHIFEKPKVGKFG